MLACFLLSLERTERVGGVCLLFGDILFEQGIEEWKPDLFFFFRIPARKHTDNLKRKIGVFCVYRYPWGLCVFRVLGVPVPVRVVSAPLMAPLAIVAILKIK